MENRERFGQPSQRQPMARRRFVVTDFTAPVTNRPAPVRPIVQAALPHLDPQLFWPMAVNTSATADDRVRALGTQVVQAALAVPVAEPAYEDIDPSLVLQLDKNADDVARFQPKATQPKIPLHRRLAAHMPRLKGPSDRLTPVLSMASATLVVTALLGSYLQFNQVRSSPDRVMRDALTAGLSITSLQKTTISGQTSSAVSYDFSHPDSPVISSRATVSQNGALFGVAGYGTVTNTYVSYQNLPANISRPLASLIKNGWIQLKANGVSPNGVSPVIADVADPHYQVFGPVLFGNVPLKNRQQVAGYLTSHNVYGYDASKVTTTKLNGQKVYVFTGKPNVGYLKLASQSAFSNQGFSLNDLKTAGNTLDRLQSAQTTIYVSKKGHQVVRAAVAYKGGLTETTDYRVAATSIAAEPQTKLIWDNFRPAQLQVLAQAAAHQPSAILDAARKADLDAVHSVLAGYFRQNNTYPSAAQLASANWVAAALPGFDPDNLHDPTAANGSLAATARSGSFAYAVQANDSTPICTSTPENPCVHYQLTATLSNGSPYTVQDP